MFVPASLLLSLLACGDTETDPTVLAGDYVFTPDSGGTGSCGAEFAGLYFLTSDPTTVTITPTDDGFTGQDLSRTTGGRGELTCVGVTDFTCDLYDGSEAASDIDATVTALAAAEGRFIGEGSLEGTWTLSASCSGADCTAFEDTYGATFPCTYTQVFTGVLE